MTQDTPEKVSIKQFEVMLQELFPDVYKIHRYGKLDSKLWAVIYGMIDMIDDQSYGDVTITFQAGKINHVFKKTNIV